MTKTNARSTKKKVVIGITVALAAILLVVLLVGNIMYYWWVYPYIWYKRVTFLTANRSSESGHVVFVGDSITDGCDLATYYPTLDAYNRGIAGDTTGGLLHRMDMSIYALNPSLVVLLIGTNDYERSVAHTNEYILRNYERILSDIHSRMPDMPVIVQSVYPIADVSFHDHYRYGHGHIEALNQGIQALCAQYGYVYADVYSLLVAGDEQMDMRYSADGLHPNDDGYRVISAFLTPIIEDCLAG